MKTNLVITTYAGKYGIMDKKNYLKYTLSLLNKINTNITQITIMKPKVNKMHDEYLNFYNFDNIEISNIKHKIKIIECENIGISYGQFFTGISHNMDFDYHFFIEDDIMIFSDNFELYLINELNKLKNDSYLCTFFFKERKWNLLKECNEKESENIKQQFIEICRSNNILTQLDTFFYEPSAPFGIISKLSVEKIMNKFNNFETINNIFNINFSGMYMHQLLFAYILFLSGIEINDISENNVNLFYHTGGNVTMCNFGSELYKWKEYPYNNEKMNIPVFCPIEFFYPYNHDDTICHLKKYFIDYEKFIEQYNMLNLEMKNLVTNLP